MSSCCLMALALLFPAQTYLATISGHLLDRDGKPLAGATVIYKKVGILDRNIQASAGMRSESPTMREVNGRVYQTKADKKGSFAITGLEYGVYQIEITGADGNHVYSGRKNVGDETDPNSQNVLNVDLSYTTSILTEPGSETNLAAGKRSKEQLDLIRQENARAARINRLIGQYRGALSVEDWPGAINYLQQLIAIDPNRWEFYQNLGTLQSNRMQYQEAAATFGKAVEVAQRTLANPADTDHALTNIGDLLLAQADAYNRLEKIDEAVELYQKAAATYPHPFMAHYRECNVLTNNGRTEAAIEACNQAIADDPAQWGPYQILGGVFTAANKPKDALDAYAKGIEVAEKALQEKPDSVSTKTGLGQMLNSQGNLLVQLKRYEESIESFSRAASVSAYPAMPYFNLCAVYYNLRRGEEALTACEHALSADPTLSEAYYIKGTVLFGQSKVEHGRFYVPPGTTESLNKYLEYAPSGEHALMVQQMISQIRQQANAPRIH